MKGHLSLHNLAHTTLKKIFILLLFFFALFSATLESKTDWTVLTYVQANNNLYGFSLKNFSDMTSIGSNENVTMLVQWFQPKQQGIWRYKVSKGKLELDECRPAENSPGTSAEELVDAMQWAVSKYPANKYSLVLWNHGIGILDPLWAGYKPWGNSKDFVNESILHLSPRIQIAGLTAPEKPLDLIIDNEAQRLSHEIIHNNMPLQTALNHADTIARSLDTVVTSTRGILFNETTRTYMDNNTFVKALSTIKTKVLNNKKIDLLGMDACLMAMVEVGYLAKDYAEVFVASQEVELAHGWPYANVMMALSSKNATAEQVAQSIVRDYATYYKDKIPFYTQSAINLKNMGDLKNSLDAFATAFKACKQTDKATILSYVRSARNSCLQFSTPGYIDLHSFFNEMSKVITQQTSIPTALNKSRDFDNLKLALSNGQNAVNNCVFACTAGSSLAQAKGLSIYFPQGTIDASYPKNDFAKDCLWYGFIKELITG